MVPNRERLLIADQDAVFRRCLQRMLERRGYVVEATSSRQRAREALQRHFFRYAIIELKLEDASGLDLLEDLARLSPRTAAIVVTGYGDVATAVTATKLGAVDYLFKPAEADEIEAALHGRRRALSRDETFPRPEVLEFRYLLAMYERHGRNMSETARAASMHRRTLQRILRRHGIGPSEQIPPDERMTTAHLRRLMRIWFALLEGTRYGTERAAKAPALLVQPKPQVVPDRSRVEA